MKIVHVVLDGEVAGGQMVALRLARAAREAGHEVSFVSPSEGPFLDRVRAAGFATRVIAVSGAADVRGLGRLARAFRAEGADVVHTHGHFSVNVLARIAARLVRARVLSHMHAPVVLRRGRGRAAQVVLDALTARLCFVIVAVSYSIRRELVRQGYPDRRILTVHNGIERACPVEPVRLADAPVVLEVARLAEGKGQRVLLAALRDVKATAVFAGRDLERGGAYEEELRAEARRLGVSERVVFAGYREDVPSLIAGSDVLCLPSMAEGLGLVLLEAMAQGKPVVASDVGGIPEVVVDGETGLLVPPGDAAALARALTELLDDPARAAAMGEAGRARAVREFDADDAAAQILRLYGDAA